MSHGLLIRILLLKIIFFCSLNFTFAQWTKYYVPVDTVNYLFTIDDTLIYSTTNSGLYLTSCNGNNWTKVSINLPDSIIYAIVKKDSNMFVSNKQGVYLTTNNGLNWVKKDNGLPDSGDYGISICGQDIFALSINKGIFVSHNHGGSWSSAFNGMLYDSFKGKYDGIFYHATSPTTFFLMTNKGLFLTSDGGNHWSASYLGLIDSRIVYCIAAEGSYFWAGTYWGLFKSTNNAAGWYPLTDGLAPKAIVSIAVKGEYIFLTQYGNKQVATYVSSDFFKNITWIGQGLPNSIPANRLLISGNYIYAICDFNVWRRPLSEVIGINPDKENNTFSLYPNPFSSHLNIDLKEYKNTQVEILAVSGKLIKKIQIDKTHTEIDLSNLLCGIYTVLIFNDTKVFSQKVIKYDSY